MNYTYLASQYCNLNTSALDIYSDLFKGQLHYICYHITTNSYYPFIQIMLELKENEFISPYVTINNDSTSADISYLILRKVKTDLKKIRCNTETLTKLLVKNAYKGIFSTTKNNLINRKVTENENNIKMYALIDVSSVDISCLNLSTICFALPTEIANINSICDIPISEDVIKLFTYLLPELGVLYKKNSGDNYLLPDIVYTYSDLKQAEFQTIFGPSKKNIYYHFNKSFLKNEAKNEAKEKDAKEKDAVNRYALFIDDPITIGISISNAKQFADLEEMLHEKYSSRTCIIVQNWNILVNKYELFTPMSYHVLQT
jgi:hypothetical protein